MIHPELEPRLYQLLDAVEEGLENIVGTLR
jgi:hypothetical protein